VSFIGNGRNSFGDVSGTKVDFALPVEMEDDDDANDDITETCVSRPAEEPLREPTSGACDDGVSFDDDEKSCFDFYG